MEETSTWCSTRVCKMCSVTQSVSCKELMYMSMENHVQSNVIAH